MDSSANAAGPALVACLAAWRRASPTTSLAANPCTAGAVTEGLISFLNLTSTSETSLSRNASWTNFVAAYCLNAPPDDGCPFGVCPNADIAGLFVRITTYVTALCANWLILFPNTVEDREDAIQGHIAIIGLQLLAGIIALLNGQLTQPHALTLGYLCGSPTLWKLISPSFSYLSGPVMSPPRGLAAPAGRAKPRLSSSETPHFQAILQVLWLFFAVLMATGIIHPRGIFSQSSCHTPPTHTVLYMLIFVELVQLLGIGPIIQRLQRTSSRTTQKFIILSGFIVLDHACYVLWVVEVELYIKDLPDQRVTYSFGQFLALMAVIPVLLSCARALRDIWRERMSQAVIRSE